MREKSAFKLIFDRKAVVEMENFGGGKDTFDIKFEATAEDDPTTEKTTLGLDAGKLFFEEVNKTIAAIDPMGGVLRLKRLSIDFESIEKEIE